jgi:tetratricopeptide (TPR) repeat protein
MKILTLILIILTFIFAASAQPTTSVSNAYKTDLPAFSPRTIPEPFEANFQKAMREAAIQTDPSQYRANALYALYKSLKTSGKSAEEIVDLLYLKMFEVAEIDYYAVIFPFADLAIMPMSNNGGLSQEEIEFWSANSNKYPEYNDFRKLIRLGIRKRAVQASDNYVRRQKGEAEKNEIIAERNVNWRGKRVLQTSTNSTNNTAYVPAKPVELKPNPNNFYEYLPGNWEFKANWQTSEEEKSVSGIVKFVPTATKDSYTIIFAPRSLEPKSSVAWVTSQAYNWDAYNNYYKDPFYIYSINFDYEGRRYTARFESTSFNRPGTYSNMTLNKRIDLDYVDLGKKAEDESNFDLAFAYYSKGIERNPISAENYFQRGGIYFIRADFRKAKADYDKAIELKSSDAAYFNNRGLCKYYLGEFYSAIVDFDSAIKLRANKSDNAKTHYWRGKANLKYNQREAAIADFRAALQLNPSYAEAKLELRLLGVEQ